MDDETLKDLQQPVVMTKSELLEFITSTACVFSGQDTSKDDEVLEKMNLCYDIMDNMLEMREANKINTNYKC